MSLHDNDGTSIVSYTTMKTILSGLCDIKKKTVKKDSNRISEPMRKVKNYVSEIKDIPGIKNSLLL